VIGDDATRRRAGLSIVNETAIFGGTNADTVSDDGIV